MANMPTVTPKSERVVLKAFIFRAFHANLKLSRINLTIITILLKSDLVAKTIIDE